MSDHGTPAAVAGNSAGMRACWAREAEGAWTPRSEPWRQSLWATGSQLSRQYPALAGPDDAAVHLTRANGSCLLNRSPQCWRSAERYRWLPAQASRMRADGLHRAQFCEITAQRTIRSVLLVGDSITWGMGQSLLGLLGVAAGATDLSAGFQKHARASVPCGRNRSVAVEVTEVTLPGSCGGEGGRGRKEVATLAAKIVSANLAVVNFGSHYGAERAARRGQNGTSPFQVFVDDVLCLASELRRAKVALPSEASRNILVWRSTPMGHPGCWSVGKGCRFGSQGRLRCERYEAPLDGGAELEGGQEGGHRHWAACAECSGSFNWPMFPGFDRVARDVLGAIGARFLDVSTMSAGRPDGHTAMKHRMGLLPPDCLHYTIPGVPDWWNALLFGAILECG